MNRDMKKDDGRGVFLVRFDFYILKDIGIYYFLGFSHCVSIEVSTQRSDVVVTVGWSFFIRRSHDPSVGDIHSWIHSIQVQNLQICMSRECFAHFSSSCSNCSGCRIRPRRCVEFSRSHRFSCQWAVMPHEGHFLDSDVPIFSYLYNSPLRGSGPTSQLLPSVEVLISL